MSRGTSHLRIQCPACGRRTAVSRHTERVRAHLRNGERCPGSGVVVDLYGPKGLLAGRGEVAS